MDSQPLGSELDAEALRIFSNKGLQTQPDLQIAGEARHNPNGLKVRRVIQLTQDLTRKPFDKLRILDLACGEGVYSIEAGLKGASVVAVDARNERMKDGAAIAARMGLSTIEFRHGDIRSIQAEDCGTFDVVYCLGILYHLDAECLFGVLENVYALCDELLVVDTWVAPSVRATAQHRGHSYGGRFFQEHRNQDSAEQRQSRLLASLDNSRSFILTRASLIRALVDIGFTSVLQCEGPLEPGKPEGRITLVARKHSKVRLATYPWVNRPSEDELAEIVYPESELADITNADYRAALTPGERSPRSALSHAAKSARQLIARTMKSALRRVGYELRRVEGDGTS